jgi:hypothetical protein
VEHVQHRTEERHALGGRRLERESATKRALALETFNFVTVPRATTRASKDGSEPLGQHKY